MTFVEFARLHGVMLDHLPPVGVWKALPTEDKPKKRNGRVKFMGDHGFVQNWATMPEVAVWQPDRDDQAPQIDHEAVKRSIEKQAQERAHAAGKAAKLAGWILHQCKLGPHQYLIDKGFPLEQGNVWTREKDGEVKKLLIVPMRIDGDLCGCQMIAEDGTKKFLTGQRTDGAVFVIDNKGRVILVEGYATALSVRAALHAIRVRFKLVVTFSAGNLSKIAATLPDAFIVADNDASGTGERVARESGRQFFMPPGVGRDFNDYHRDVGIFKASQALRLSLMEKRA